jgi:hypothetical protein
MSPAASDSLHCTLAVTAAVPFKVKVQVFRLLPPLEHAPDQIASLPLLAVRVMLVPEVKGACMELPTATLIPAGLDVTRSPLRPVAVTVRTAVVTGGAAGFTVRGAILVRPPAVAKMVNPVDVATGAVGTEKDTLVSPAGTVTVIGTVAIGLLLEIVAANPLGGAGLVTARMASVEVPPVTTLGNKPMLNSVAGGGGGKTVTVATFEELL